MARAGAERRAQRPKSEVAVRAKAAQRAAHGRKLDSTWKTLAATITAAMTGAASHAVSDSTPRGAAVAAVMATGTSEKNEPGKPPAAARGAPAARRSARRAGRLGGPAMPTLTSSSRSWAFRLPAASAFRIARGERPDGDDRRDHGHEVRRQPQLGSWFAGRRAGERAEVERGTNEDELNAALAGDTPRAAATYEMPSQSRRQPARSRSTISVVTSFVKFEAAKSTASAAITATIRRRRPKQSERRPSAPGIGQQRVLSSRMAPTASLLTMRQWARSCPSR